jgi:PAS domain S-box-containing protein
VDANVTEGRRFARRVYHPRIIGLGLGFLCAASVLYQKDAPAVTWLGLVVNTFVWPHLAYLLAISSGNPRRAETRNLMLDSFFGGLWIPLISFNLLPSATFVFMLSMDKLAVGGVRFFARGLAALAAGILVSLLLFGFDFRPESTMLNVLACLPILGLYSLSVGIATHRFAQKLNRQKGEIEKINVALQESHARLTEAYERMMENDHRYRLISENAGDVIWLWDLANNCYSYVSPSVTRLHGFTVDEVMRQTMADALPPDSLSILMTEMPRRLQALEAGDETARAQSYEMMHFRKDGTLVPTEVMTTVITDEQGNPMLIQGITRDISSRKEVEAKLRESKAQLDLALTSARMGTWYIDLIDQRRHPDKRACELLDIDPAQFKGELAEFMQVVHPDDRQKVRDAVARTIEMGELYELEYRIVRRNGDIRYISTRGMLVRDDAGRPVRINGVLWDSTEKKRTEEALQESERKFRDLSEKSMVGVYLVQDNVYKYANAEFARIFGYGVEEITDKIELKDLIHPDDLPLVEENIQRRISGELQSLSYGFRICTKTGEIRHVEVHSSRTSYRGKSAVIGSLLDVTNRKRMEEALRESEEKYRSIFENAKEGIFQSTPEGRFLRVNPAMARTWGYASPEEMIKQVVDLNKQHYVDPQDREHFKAVMADQGSVEGWKVEIYRKDRARIWVSLNVRAVYDDAGRIIYYEGTNEDITEQKLMEDMIRENERRYRHLVENSNDIIFTTDLSGILTYVNPATERISGYAVSQLYGKDFFKLVRADYHERLKCLYRRQLDEKGATTYYEFPIVTSDGQERWIGQQMQLIYEKTEAVGFQATARDITDRLKAEEEHRQREKLGAIIEMAGGVCHEMNQPLQIIYGLSDLMTIRTPKDNPLYPQIMDIKNAVERMSAITKRLTGITRYETKQYAGDRKIVDIDKSSHE